MQKKIFFYFFIFCIGFLFLFISFLQENNIQPPEEKTLMQWWGFSIWEKQLFDWEWEKSEAEIIFPQVEKINIINQVWITWNIWECEKVEDILIKQECIDNWNLAKASFENDIQYCDRVKNNIKKTKCRDNYFYNQALFVWNQANCYQIEDISLEYNCKKSIIFSILEIEKDLNISLCSVLIWEDKSNCLLKVQQKKDEILFLQALDKKEINICKKIQTPIIQMNCKDTFYMQEAIEINDIKKCSFISDLTTKNKCDILFKDL